MEVGPAVIQAVNLATEVMAVQVGSVSFSLDRSDRYADDKQYKLYDRGALYDYRSSTNAQ